MIERGRHQEIGRHRPQQSSRGVRPLAAVSESPTGADGGSWRLTIDVPRDDRLPGTSAQARHAAQPLTPYECRTDPCGAGCCRCALADSGHEQRALGRHRAVDASTGEIEFRVRGSRLVRTNNGETSYRVRDDGRVVDANSGETRYRVRDDGRVVDVNTGETVWRLRG